MTKKCFPCPGLSGPCFGVLQKTTPLLTFFVNTVTLLVNTWACSPVNVSDWMRKYSFDVFCKAQIYTNCIHLVSMHIAVMLPTRCIQVVLWLDSAHMWKQTAFTQTSTKLHFANMQSIHERNIACLGPPIIMKHHVLTRLS